MIKLIINADDFGYSKVFNEKILYLLDKGFIKSTTVMVDRITKEQNNQTKELIELHKNKPISVGLHLELDIKKQIRPQVEQQYKKFTSIFGFKPSHIDLHKSGQEEILVEVNKFAEEHDLPVRNMGVKSSAKQTTHRYFYDPKNKKFEMDKAIIFLSNVKDGESCEFVTHPGRYDPNCESSLNKEREEDYKNIIKFQKFLKSHKNIQNISYLQL